MNFFCRLLGHTWVMKTEEPKIRWSTEPKSLALLELTADGEPVFYWECARCRERRVLDSADYRRTEPGEGRPEAAGSASSKAS